MMVHTVGEIALFPYDFTPQAMSTRAAQARP